MISLQNISKVYRTKYGMNQIFSKLSLDIPTGSNVGILGKNGAGKSTLLRIIAGIEEPDSGRVVRNARISWPIGFSGGFNGSLTGEENCRFVSRIYSEDIRKVIDFVVQFSELGMYFFMPVRTYSAGMKARLAFALSMAIEFDVYLVDEITAVGDLAFQAKCNAAFRKRQDRSDIIIVSHHINTLKEYCSIFAILENGIIRLYRDIDIAMNAYNKKQKE